MHALRSLLYVVRDSRKKMGLAIACGLLFAATGLIPPLLIRRLIQWTTDGGGTFQALSTLTLLLLLVYLGRGLSRYGYGRFSHPGIAALGHLVYLSASTAAQGTPVEAGLAATHPKQQTEGALNA